MAPVRWKLPLALFLASVVSILAAGAIYAQPGDAPFRLQNGIPFAVSLLSILLTHEFGHYIAARAHRVNASLPLFIPLPLLSMWGTLGAVIVMRDRIRSRNALLDIGAAGPLAGLTVAIPVLLYGLSHSSIIPLGPQGRLEGQCLLYSLLKYLALPPIPPGYDVDLNSVAWAGWVGLLVTMLNLLPVGQLDGGHVAYALFGARQSRFSAFFRWALLGVAVINFVYYLAIAGRPGAHSNGLGTAQWAALSWLIWFVLLTTLRRLSDEEHPPPDPGELSPFRRFVAALTLVVFVLLFMPTMVVEY